MAWNFGRNLSLEISGFEVFHLIDAYKLCISMCYNTNERPTSSGIG